MDKSVIISIKGTQTYEDAAKDVQKTVSNETVLVVVTYFDAAGVELASQSYSSADCSLV